MEPVSTTATVVAAAALTMKGISLVSDAKSNKKAARRRMEQLKKEQEAIMKRNFDQAEMATMNKEIALSNMKRLDKQEYNTLSQSLQKRNEMIKAQESAVNASGFSLRSGSMNAIRKQTIIDNSIDNKAIKESFSNGRLNFKIQAENYRKTAYRLLESATDINPLNNSYSLGGNGMTNSLLSGAADLSSQAALYWGGS